MKFGLLMVVSFSGYLTFTVLAEGQLSSNFSQDEIDVGLKKAKHAVMSFSDYMKNPKVSTEKKTEFKALLDLEVRKADPGRPCCKRDVQSRQVCQYSFLEKFQTSCGFLWLGRCYSGRTTYRAVPCKSLNPDLEKAVEASAACPKRDQVCCPGTVWYGYAGKCIEEEKFCKLCDCCGDEKKMIN